MCLLSHLQLRTETDPVSETSCSLKYQTMEEVQTPNNSVCFSKFVIFIIMIHNRVTEENNSR
jgi:hypothetical protein